MEPNTIFPATAVTVAPKRNDIPVKWGLIIGLVSCLWTTVSFMVVLKSSYIGFLVMTFLGFLVTIILSGVAAAQQRKAQGGFITFREAFRVVFISILLAMLISTVYGIVYTKYIDPESVPRMKEHTLGFMERMGTPQDKIDETSAEFDKQQASSMGIGRIALGFAQGLILYSLVGLLVALIVRRNPPQNAVGIAS